MKTSAQINSMVGLKQLLDKGVSDRAFTHYSAAFGNLNFGKFQYISNTNLSMCFDLASMSKALSTSVLIHILAKRYDFSLKSTIGLVIQNLGVTLDLDPIIKQMSIDDLLGHRSRFPPWACLWINRLGVVDNLWEKRQEHIVKHLNRTIRSRNCTTPAYSDLGYILLGLLVEKIEGMSLNEVFTKSIGSKLDGYMGYNAYKSPYLPGLVSTGFCKIRNRQLIGEVHDENCAALGGVSGHAGLFSSIESVVELLVLLNRGEYNFFFDSNAEIFLLIKL